MQIITRPYMNELLLLIISYIILTQCSLSIKYNILFALIYYFVFNKFVLNLIT